MICFVVDKANILSRKRNRDNAAVAKSLKGRSLRGIDATAEQKKISAYFCHSCVRNMTPTEGSHMLELRLKRHGFDRNDSVRTKMPWCHNA